MKYQTWISLSSPNNDLSAAANDVMGPPKLVSPPLSDQTGVTDFVFVKAPTDYYDRSIESRLDNLGAASIHHRCNRIVLVNTQAPSQIIDCAVITIIQSIALLLFCTLFDSMLKRLKTVCLHSTMGRYLKRKSIVSCYPLDDHKGSYNNLNNHSSNGKEWFIDIGCKCFSSHYEYIFCEFSYAFVNK